MKAEYFPQIETPLFGKLSASLSKVINLSTSSKIVNIQVKSDATQIVWVKFVLKDLKEFEFGKDPTPGTQIGGQQTGNQKTGTEAGNEAKTEDPNSLDFPIYDRIKQVYVYGESNQIKGLGFEIIP